MNYKLRETRERQGKTQAQIAEEAKISITQYQNYEYEKSEPGVITAKLIAKALNSTVEELF